MFITEDIDVPEGEGEAPPRYEEIIDGDSGSVSGASSSGDKSKFNITNPIKSIIKKEKNKVREIFFVWNMIFPQSLPEKNFWIKIVIIQEYY